MITARIKTQTREINLKNIYQTHDAAIDALQNAVYSLTPEDGRCYFFVLNNGNEIYSWNYQPTFPEGPVNKMVKKPESKYICYLVYYVLLNGLELAYDNLYHDSQSFDSVKEARAYMKKHGWDCSEYQIVYEYSVDGLKDEYTYGWGMGFTREEAREKLNQSIGYYNLKLLKNGMIKEL